MNVNEFPTFPNNAALPRGTRVLMSGGYLAAASATQDEFGTMKEGALATDTVAAIVPIGYHGVREMVCSTAVTAYATVYAAASGKVAPTGTLRRGIALQAGSGDGAIIRVLSQAGSGAPVL